MIRSKDRLGGHLHVSLRPDWEHGRAHSRNQGQVVPAAPVEHTGLIKASGSDCDRVDLTTGNLVYDDGVITEYGANGDYLFGTYTNGHGTLGGAISDEWTIIGGTGRFAGATGHGTETFDLLVPPGSITFTSTPLPFINPWDGWISY